MPSSCITHIGMLFSLICKDIRMFCRCSKHCIKKKLVLGILTDLTAHIQYRKLEALEISDFFDMIITSEEAGEDKPSDKMFNLLFEKTKNNPDELLMIGDSQEKDIAGAQKHGINTILYTKHTDIIKEAEKYI